MAKKSPASKPKSDGKSSKKFDMSKLKKRIQGKLETGEISREEAEIMEQRAPAEHGANRIKNRDEHGDMEHFHTGIPGFDDLFDKGVPKGSSTILAGGTGSGKTIFCLQMLAYHAARGKKCFYMSFEESEDRLIGHMDGFGWAPKKLIESKNLMIKRYSPFDVTRSIDAMLADEKGELMIDVDPVMLPEGFEPDVIVVDSLTAISSVFTGRKDSYRIYIEQLFRFLERINATSFLITETKQVPEIFSASGVEEFLADGVIVIYNFKRGDVRERAIEILKLRGEKHQKRMVAMQIGDGGVRVYPEQPVFGG